MKRYTLNHSSQIITDHILNLSIVVMVNPDHEIISKGKGISQSFNFQGNQIVLFSSTTENHFHSLKRAFKWYRSQVYISNLK